MVKEFVTVDLGPGYMDAFSNCSVFISLRFQIDPLWIAYSDIRVFMIVFVSVRVNTLSSKLVFVSHCNGKVTFVSAFTMTLSTEYPKKTSHF